MATQALLRRDVLSDIGTRTAFSSSLTSIERLEKTNTLRGHDGCVNTLSFNKSGSKLISGSDDRKIKLWNYYTGEELASFHSGHTNNIFQAYMKTDDEATFLTCAADGRVRVTMLGADGTRASSKLLCTHKDRAHKLALCPDNPNQFYSCGEDGRVYLHDLRSEGPQAFLTCGKDGGEHQRFPMALYSIHCNPYRSEQFVVGGRDMSTRVYDQRFCLHGVIGTSHDSSAIGLCMAEPVRTLVPSAIKGSKSHVTCAVFSKDGSILSTYGSGSGPNGPHPGAETAAQRVSRSGRRPSRKRDRAAEVTGKVAALKTSSDSPQSTQHQVTSTGCPNHSQKPVNSQRNKDEDEVPRTVEAEHDSLDSSLRARLSQPEATPSQIDAATLATLPDFRAAEPQPSSEDRPLQNEARDDVNVSDPSAIASRTGHIPRAQTGAAYQQIYQDISDDDEDWEEPASHLGDSDEEDDAFWAEHIGSGSEREAPTDKDAESGDEVLMTFQGHQNEKTVKGVSFLGHNDEYVMSGSDCGHIFIWRRSDGKLLKLLKGDYDVVNCLAQHPSEPLSFATSGIEDTIKLWAPEGKEAQPLNEEEAASLQKRNRASAANSRLQPFMQALFFASRLHDTRRLILEVDDDEEAQELIFSPYEEDLENSDEDGDQDSDNDANSEGAEPEQSEQEREEERRRRRREAIAQLRNEVLDSME